MRHTIIAFAAAALVAAALPSSAQARCHGCGLGAGIAAGVIGGAIVGGAIANSRPPVYVEPGIAYAAPPPDYIEPPDYVPEPTCHMERQQVWDGYGYRLRNVEICE